MHTCYDRRGEPSCCGARRGRGPWWYLACSLQTGALHSRLQFQTALTVPNEKRHEVAEFINRNLPCLCAHLFKHCIVYLSFQCVHNRTASSLLREGGGLSWSVTSPFGTFRWRKVPPLDTHTFRPLFVRLRTLLQKLYVAAGFHSRLMPAVDLFYGNCEFITENYRWDLKIDPLYPGIASVHISKVNPDFMVT